MKAVIVEIRGKSAAALSDDGCIVKVKNDDYAIGQVIEMKIPAMNKSKKLAVWASCAAAVVMVCGIGAYAYTAPYSYVSMDVNPSIEYSLNRFDRVLSVKAVNDDGSEILKEIKLTDLNYKKIDEAIGLTIDQISKEGYFDGDIEGGIVIATSAEDSKKAEELAASLQQTVEEDTKENGDEVEVEAISVGKDRVAQARELGVTPGKLNLVEKLRASAENPESIDMKEWLNKPVKEIMKATKENKKASKQAEEETTTESVSEQTAAKAADAQQADTSAEDTALAAESKTVKTEKKMVGAAEKAEQKKVSAAQSTEQKKAIAAQNTEQKNAASVQKAEQKAVSTVEKTADKAQSQTQKEEQQSSVKEEKETAAAEKTADKAEEKSEKDSEKESKSSGNSKK